RRNLRPWSTAFEKLSRSGPRTWWAAAGVLLLGFVVAWLVVLSVKTSNGMIELVNLPKDAEVLVDGEEVAVTWPGGGKPAVVTVTAGKHKIMVKKDGLEISGDEVTVPAEGREKFTVRFVPPSKRTHELPKDDGQAPINNSIGMTLKLIPAGEFFLALASWCAGSVIKQPCEPVLVTYAPGAYGPDAKCRVHRCAARLPARPRPAPLGATNSSPGLCSVPIPPSRCISPPVCSRSITPPVAVAGSRGCTLSASPGTR